MRLTKQIKDSDYGYTTFNNEIGVNLEGLYNDSESEESFIENYSKIILHEYLHLLIANILFDLYEDYEEYIVGKISDTNRLSLKPEENKYLFQVIR